MPIANIFRNQFIGLYGNKILIFYFFTILLTIVDSSLVRISAMNQVEVSEFSLKFVFSIIVFSICLMTFFCSYEIRRSFKSYDADFQKDLFIVKYSMFIQILLVLFLMTIFISVNLFAFYNLLFLYVLIILSHVIGLFYISWLIVKIIRWFLNNKNSIVLLFLISFSLFSVFVIISMLNYALNLTNLSRDVHYLPYYQVIYMIGLALADWQITNTYSVLLFVSFLFMWMTTSLLLNQYIKRINRIYFWSLVSVPLGFYITQFLLIQLDYLSFLILINPINNLIIYEFLFIFSTPIVGILFGIIMLLISKKFANREMRNNLRILSIGFMLLFCSFQPNSLLYKTFPPFGISLTLMSLGAILVSASLYRIIYVVTKNIAVFRELINVMGEKNFLVYFSEGKKLHELDQVINQVNRSINQSQFDQQSESKDLSGEEVKDILAFIKEELDKKASLIGDRNS